MSSLPASQPAEDGEADGATAPPTVDPSSEEPPVTHGGVRKSVGSPLTGAQPNVRELIFSHSYNFYFGREYTLGATIGAMAKFAHVTNRHKFS